MKKGGEKLSYTSDISDSQWKEIEQYFKNGNRSKHSKRDLVNAVLYIVKTGCQWRQLPHDFPPVFTVHSFYRRARLDGTWERILESLVEKTRIKAGRNANPSYSLIDSQSVKATYASERREIDGGKKKGGAEKAHSD
jgi:putative transposase